ncbi:MAG: sigma-54-dependent Fis family transcriptional regulator [Segniliparus sp.]|uniref:sigma-54-dependent Fis family transcriptional regulator n=1 Tax=Segniliparus sp. TaxID=2804064 RepID=UPI003F34BC84
MRTDQEPRARAIAESWRRSRLCGVDPRSCLDDDRTLGEAGHGQIAEASATVLDGVLDKLAGTGFVLVLGDRNARVVDIRAGDKMIRNHVERSGVTVGRVLAEETAGTNCVGTVVETREGLRINGPEHYAEALRGFHCYGHPVVNPVTKRLAGVLDMSCVAAEDTALIEPFVVATVREIERELAARASADDHALVDAFRISCGQRPGAPVVVIGATSLFTNNAAASLLTQADHIALRAVADSVTRRAATTMTTVELRGGTARVEAECKQGGVVLVLDFEAAKRDVVSVPPQAPHASSSVTIIAGEPGTGRTTEARRLVEGAATAWLPAFDSADRGKADRGQADRGQSGQSPSSWLAEARTALASSQAVVIEDVHLLSPSLARHLAVAIGAAGSEASVVLTSGPLAQLGGEHARLVALCHDHVELLPLRARRGDIPAFIRTMLGQDSGAHLSTDAVDVLTRQEWPGNLAELAAVVSQVGRLRACGEITVADLPEPYRRADFRRRLTPLEQAERDAVVEALRRTGGNKRLAAEYLGMSRTTLYSAIRRYRVDASRP